jgi:hypothetical protein
LSKKLRCQGTGTDWVATLGITTFAHADTVTLDLSTAGLAGGASLIGGGSKIKLDPNTAGEMATLSFASVSGQQYSISVTGENDSSASFFNFLIDTFVSLASNVNFGSGFNTITLPSFIDLGTSDLLRIVNGGTGNSGGQISGVAVSSVPLPSAIGLFASGLGGIFLLGRRRKRKAIVTA